jgi:hypothetical protein
MLFILVMDVLNSLFNCAVQEGLLQPLAVQQCQHRISFYGDDVVLFLRPIESEPLLVKELLKVFGQATGLVTNIAKSSATPIQCNVEERSLITNTLECDIKDFPCNYLGLPLSVHKLPRSELHKLVDKVANNLPNWKGVLMNKFVDWSRSRLSYPPLIFIIWLLLTYLSGCSKQLTRSAEAFFGSVKRKLREEIVWFIGIRCNVASGQDGFGFKKLNLAGLGVDCQVPKNAWPLFNFAVQTTVGDGKNTLFWADRWLEGRTIQELAANLFKTIPKRIIKHQTVSQVLLNRGWVADIKGAFTIHVLSEYLMM